MGRPNHSAGSYRLDAVERLVSSDARRALDTSFTETAGITAMRRLTGPPGRLNVRPVVQGSETGWVKTQSRSFTGVWQPTHSCTKPASLP